MSRLHLLIEYVCHLPRIAQSKTEEPVDLFCSVQAKSSQAELSPDLELGAALVVDPHPSGGERRRGGVHAYTASHERPTASCEFVALSTGWAYSRAKGCWKGDGDKGTARNSSTNGQSPSSQVSLFDTRNTRMCIDLIGMCALVKIHLTFTLVHYHTRMHNIVRHAGTHRTSRTIRRLPHK